MNYYERHLGDYARDTAHLTMIEHGAYTLLLDRYYATEAGIPADQAHRVARARSKEEKQAVDAVLSEFFTLNEGVWIKGRVDEEITKAQSKIKAAQENGKRGGRPKSNPVKTQEKPSGFFLGSENETQKKAHQTPDTRHQTPESAVVTPESIPQAGGTEAGMLCARLVKLGIAGVNPSHPKLLALMAAGLTADEIEAAGAEAKAKGKGFAWALAAAEGRRRDAASVTQLPARKGPEWWATEAGAVSKGKELGLNPRPGESMPEFKGRIQSAMHNERATA